MGPSSNKEPTAPGGTPGRGGDAAMMEPPAAHALTVSGLTKTFGATRALDDVSIEICPAEVHALMGQNGSGKSTVIKALAGYHEPDGDPEGVLDGVPFQIGAEVPEGL